MSVIENDYEDNFCNEMNYSHGVFFAKDDILCTLIDNASMFDNSVSTTSSVSIKFVLLKILLINMNREKFRRAVKVENTTRTPGVIFYEKSLKKQNY